ncbi:hypothetical protein [endosymbiont of Lamellibrachia barhami]|uniref:hypothetical protein n=1 Tax=endosymbiont of Lamellibrachia barhami TaxID=205975 RepID=UPI0015B0B361|nr:hypothetical protein [endosymbiont of Lamellibrachia barhami]
MEKEESLYALNSVNQWVVENIPPELAGAIITAAFIYFVSTIRENRIKNRWILRKKRELKDELSKARGCIKRLREIRSKGSDFMSLSEVKEIHGNQQSIIRVQEYVYSWVHQIHDLTDVSRLTDFEDIDKKLYSLIGDLDRTVSDCYFVLGRFQVNSTKKLLDAYIDDTRDPTKQFLVDLSDMMPEMDVLGEVFESTIIGDIDELIGILEKPK